MLKVNLLKFVGFVLSFSGVLSILFAKADPSALVIGVVLAVSGYLLDLDSRISYYDVILKQAKEKHEKENQTDEQGS